MGLGCAKTPTLAPHVEISLIDCISESRIMLHTPGSVPLENRVFYISRMYEFLHSQGQNRRSGTMPEHVRSTSVSRLSKA
jgi:hypothetical protein